MEQMMERLLAVVAGIEVSQERMIAKMDVHQERMDSHHQEMMVIMKACLGKPKVKMETGQEKLKATDLEPNPGKRKGSSGNYQSIGEPTWGQTSGHRVLPTAEEMYPG
jgi:hypothetical protein